MKSYYLCQKIQWFKGKDYSVMENWQAALEFAHANMKWAVENDIMLYSPAALTIPFAMALKLDESPENRNLYFKIDEMIIDRLRAAGELIWIVPADWYESAGCRIEVRNALLHNEKIIRYGQFNANKQELDLLTDVGIIKEEFNMLAVLLIETEIERRKFKNW